MSKNKQKHSSLKLIYGLIIVLLPVYAAFAIQFVPREHQGDPAGGQGWPFLVCGPVDEVGDIGLLLVNATIIALGIYALVVLSAVIRFQYFNQQADGSPRSKTRRKKS